MRRVQTTAGVLFLGGLGGLVSGVLVSLGAVMIGPDAMPPGAPNAADVLVLAILQGVYVGGPLGLILGPLAYFGMGRGKPPYRLALLAGMATVGLGVTFATLGGAPAGLAGGLLGFYAAARLARGRRAPAEPASVGVVT